MSIVLLIMLVGACSTDEPRDSASTDAASVSPQSLAEGSPPRDAVVKVAWVERFVNTEVEAEMQRRAERYGFALGEEPEGWNRRPYIASARTRPDIGEYFTKYAAYAADLEARLDALTDSVATRRIALAEFSASDAEDFTERCRRELAKSTAVRKQVVAAMARQAQAALAIHQLLVEIDPRVSLDADGELAFQVDQERRRYEALASRFTDASVFLQTLLEREQARLDSLRTERAG